jgi:hypothetical protein
MRGGGGGGGGVPRSVRAPPSGYNLNHFQLDLIDVSFGSWCRRL